MAEYHGITVGTEKGTHTVFPELCKGCGLCIAKCPKYSTTEKPIHKRLSGLRQTKLGG